MKKALITYGGWEGHQPRETAELFAALLEERGLQVRLYDTLAPLADAEALKLFDLIIPDWTMAKIGDHEIAGLKAAVESGVGLAGWHGGLGDSFRECVDYQFMVGGQWVAHPGGFIDHEIQIVADDPIVDGLPRRFSLHSEQYYMHVDPSNEVLAVTTFGGEVHSWIEGATIPVAWKRHWGRGRVFYCSIGHSVDDFNLEPARELVVRGMLWAARA